MVNIQKFHSADLNSLVERINKYSIGMDDVFDRLSHVQEGNYPPYNLVQVSSTESRLELALAGFNEKELNVYTQDGKLFVEGTKEEPGEQTTYYHRGVAQRSFTRSWSLGDETEVRSVSFENGLLTVELCKIIPEHHQRKDWF
jgi:molecular chaperone IbpA